MEKMNPWMIYIILFIFAIALERYEIKKFYATMSAEAGKSFCFLWFVCGLIVYDLSSEPSILSSGIIGGVIAFAIDFLLRRMLA